MFPSSTITRLLLSLGLVAAPFVWQPRWICLFSGLDSAVRSTDYIIISYRETVAHSVEREGAPIVGTHFAYINNIYKQHIAKKSVRVNRLFIIIGGSDREEETVLELCTKSGFLQQLILGEGTTEIQFAT